MTVPDTSLPVPRPVGGGLAWFPASLNSRRLRGLDRRNRLAPGLCDTQQATRATASRTRRHGAQWRGRRQRVTEPETLDRAAAGYRDDHGWPAQVVGSDLDVRVGDTSLHLRSVACDGSEALIVHGWPESSLAWLPILERAATDDRARGGPAANRRLHTRQRGAGTHELAELPAPVGEELPRRGRCRPCTS